MRRTTGYIPRNLGGGTLWDGRLKKRNAVEAVIVCVIVYLITKLLELFLPYLIVISIRLILWVLLGGLALNGAYGEPLSLYILNIINYSNSRTYVTLKPPQRKIQKEEKKAQKPEKKKLSDRILTKGQKKHGKKKSEEE